VDLYIDFCEAFSKEGDERLERERACERLKAFWRARSFEVDPGEGGSPVAFMLGVASYGSFGQELRHAGALHGPGPHVQGPACQLIEESRATSIRG